MSLGCSFCFFLGVVFGEFGDWSAKLGLRFGAPE